MHHKRGRPKNRRAGCLWCKPHKANGVTKQPRNKRALAALSEPVARMAIEAEDITYDRFCVMNEC